MLEAVSKPSAEPLTVQEVRVHLGQAGDSPSGSPLMFESLPDESWIRAKITAAREDAERFLGYPLTDALYRLTFADFTGRAVGSAPRTWPFGVTNLQLPQGFGILDRIEYLDGSNQVQTLAGSTYDYDPVTRYVYADGAWPALSTRPSPVRVFARGEYGVDSPLLPVPEAVKHAMLLMIGEWYLNREETIEGRVATTPLGVEYLLRPLRTRLGMA